MRNNSSYLRDNLLTVRREFVALLSIVKQMWRGCVGCVISATRRSFG